MWGIKLVYTPDRTRQERILAQIKERQAKERQKKDTKNANPTN